MASDPVRVNFYGGLGEVGRNMATIEVDGRIALVDCGVQFAREEDPGVDLILPDWRDLRDRADDVVGVFLTHGHMDHFGALPYLLLEIPRVPILGSRLTLCLVESLLEEWTDEIEMPPLIEFRPGDRVHHEGFDVDTIPVSHSVPGSAAFLFRTPHGTILHSGDFKLDQTPVGTTKTDLGRFGQLGSEGVDLLLVDSTNAEIPGHEPSEVSIREELFQQTFRSEGRVVAATFASHIDRIRQLLDAAEAAGRRVAVIGRSMINNVRIASELGLIERHVAFRVEELADVPRTEQFIICTGSQGEAFSALGRLSRGEFLPLSLEAGDTVILTSSIIPGNEVEVFRVLNGLARQGARIAYSHTHEIHVSGHARRHDLELYLGLIQPRWVVPVHGEARHLVAQSELAQGVGVPRDHVLLCLNGDGVELEDGEVRRLDGVVSSGRLYLEGGTISPFELPLRNRRKLGERGVWVVVVDLEVGAAGPRAAAIAFQQRGVIDPTEEDELFAELTPVVEEAVGSADTADPGALHARIEQELNTTLNHLVGRKPVVLSFLQRAGG